MKMASSFLLPTLRENGANVDTLVRWGFWRTLSMGSENGENKPPKLNSPSPPPLPPSPQELSLGDLFSPFSLPIDKVRTRTLILLVCLKGKRKENWETTRAAQTERETAPENFHLDKCAGNILTRWQQQVIRRMFCRCTTDQSTRLTTASPDR